MASKAVLLLLFCAIVASAQDPTLEERVAALETGALPAGVINKGDNAWMMTSSALVMLMTPALGLFYGGLANAENVSNTIMMCFVSVAVVTLQWVLFGYSFAFGYGSEAFGSFGWVALTGGVSMAPSTIYATTIPQYTFVAFQCMFAQITPAIISGAIIGRMKFISYIIFIAVWTTTNYDLIAHLVWALTPPAGWLGVEELGALDFAGGTVIHITSGWSSLAAACVLGKRRNFCKVDPHNVPMCILGAALLWFGWFGFNAGSAGAASGTAALAFLNTHIAASAAFLMWIFLEWVFDKHATAVGGAIGGVVGLVGITPACGFVWPMSAIAIGAVTAAMCFGGLYVKKLLKFDDTLDVWACHGVGGTVGAFLTGLFADGYLTAGTTEGELFEKFNGAFYGRPILLGYQVVGIVIAIAISVTQTTLILLILKYTIGLRVSEESEDEGLDRSVHGAESYKNQGLNGSIHGMDVFNVSKPIQNGSNVGPAEVQVITEGKGVV